MLFINLSIYYCSTLPFNDTTGHRSKSDLSFSPSSILSNIGTFFITGYAHVFCGSKHEPWHPCASFLKYYWKKTERRGRIRCFWVVPEGTGQRDWAEWVIESGRCLTKALHYKYVLREARLSGTAQGTGISKRKLRYLSFNTPLMTASLTVPFHLIVCPFIQRVLDN